jgi:Protein of unknown function (DUF664)
MSNSEGPGLTASPRVTDASEDEPVILLAFLEKQRASVLSVVEGLSEAAWHTSVVPSGWTPAGLVEHLGNAERHWFQGVVTGVVQELPWDEGRPPYDPFAAFGCDRPSADIIAFYRDQCRRSDEVLAVTGLSAPPRGAHPDPEIADQVTSVRWIVLHMIEETAAHSGHLEVARELIDGQTGFGRR